MSTNNAINNDMSFANYHRIEKLLSSSDINNMFATPVQLIPAPGSNKAILPCRIYRDYKFNTTAATGGGGISLVYASDNTTLAYSSSLSSIVLTGTSSAFGKIAGGSYSPLFTKIDNSAVNLTNDTGAFVGGDCSFELTIYYMVINLV